MNQEIVGVSGSILTKRMRNIVINSNAVAKIVLAWFGTAAMAAPILAQSVPLPSAIEPRFEVASIKRISLDNCNPSAGSVTPGRLNLCGALTFYVQQAYEVYAKGRGFNPAAMTPQWAPNIEGAPAWMNSELYHIEAKADGTTPVIVMRGPMLQALFEERLKLKVRREIRQVPVYELTVARGGPKLQRVKDGTCVPFDPMKPPPEPTGAGQAPPQRCGGVSIGKGTLEFSTMTLSDFSQYLGRNIVVRPIIDKTGLAGRFDFHLAFAPDENTPMLRRGAEDITGPSIFTAIEEQLGLKLERAIGPHEFLIIDSVERPSEN